MEELLKAYARQRRKDASESLQMPERTRNLLLRAAVRPSAPQHAAQEVPSWRDRIMSLWPRLAVGAGVATAVLLVAVMMQPAGRKPRSAEFATAEKIAATAPVPLVQPVGTKVASLKAREADASADRRGGGLAKARDPQAEVAAVAVALKGLEVDKRLAADMAAPTKSEEAKTRLRATGKQLASAPAATPAGVAGPEGASNIAALNYGGRFQRANLDDAQQVLARRGMRFAQVAPRKSAGDVKQQLAVQQQVLASFQLEQRGDHVVVQDADGSTYEGQIQQLPAVQAPAAPLQRAETTEQAAPQRAAQVAAHAAPAQGINVQPRGQAAGQQVFFTLSGINRSLNQRVVFNGNLTLDEPRQRAGDAPAKGIAVTTAPAAAAPTGPPRPAELQLQQRGMAARIQGKARLSDGSELDIDAVSIGP